MILQKAKNFFSAIFKNKKLSFFVILFFTITGIISPQPAAAIAFLPVVYFIGDVLIYYFAIKGTIALFGKQIVEAAAYIVLGITKILEALTGGLVTIAGNFLETVTKDDFVKYCYTCNQNPVISAGWPVMRDLANMLIVLGFVVIGIATTLRIGEYGAKKLLPKLIIVALLINFSLLATGIFVDGSNIIMKWFLQKANPSSLVIYGQSITKTETDAVAKRVTNNQKEDALATASYALAESTLVFIYNTVLFIVFSIFGLLFLFRYVGIWIFVIFSPLAFVCYVFPFTKKYFDTWCNNFLKYCFIGMPAAFFLWMAAAMADSLSKSDPPVSTLVALIVPTALLFAGYKISMKTSAFGASTAIGLASGAVGYALGATGKIGKFAAGATGLTRAGNAVKTGVVRAGESLGLVSPGAAASAESKRLDEPKKRLAALDSQRLATIAQQSAWTKKQSEDKAAAAHILAERGDLDEIKNENDRAAVVAHASSFPGVKRSDFEKVDPSMAKYNTAKVKEYMKPVAQGGKGLSETDAKQLLTDEAYAKLDVPAIRKLPKGSLNLDFIKNVGTKRFERASIEMKQEQIDEMKKYTTSGSPERAKLRALITSLPKGSKERNNLIKNFLLIKSL